MGNCSSIRAVLSVNYFVRKRTVIDGLTLAVSSKVLEGIRWADRLLVGISG